MPQQADMTPMADVRTQEWKGKQTSVGRMLRKGNTGEWASEGEVVTNSRIRKRGGQVLFKERSHHVKVSPWEHVL